MSAARETLAAKFNRDCDCSCTDLAALHRRLDADLAGAASGSIVESHPHLFSTTPVFLDPAEARGMRRVVEAVESVVQLPGYRQAIMDRAPAIARNPAKAHGVFTGFDFHLAPAGPRLIEINTNAGGAFLNAAARDAQRACCRATGRRPLEDEFFAMFLREWRLARGEQPLRTIAIVDENPRQQYLYPEFELARRMLSQRGIAALIADPSELEVRADVLFARGQPVDLVYNRLTDFYLDDPRNASIRHAYEQDLAVVTPHPRAHALYADKHNLELLGDPDMLNGLGARDDAVERLVSGIPRTRAITSGAEHWWRERKQWFFKPRHGFGSRGAYRGDKMTRRVFDDVMSGHYVAQRLTPPSERWRTTDGGRKAFKVDVRCYTYGGKVQLMAARLYQGQTTNFRTAGGGFAPVYTVHGLA